MVLLKALPSEAQKKRSLLRRMLILHAFLLVCLLCIVTRLLELQVFDRNEYYAAAQSQHFGGVRLPAQRGEILARNSKTGETSILATNTTLGLAYVDPLITDDPASIADLLAATLITQDFHVACMAGADTCPRELTPFYAPAFDPLTFARRIATGALLEPLPMELPTIPADVTFPDVTEVRRQFARDIERRISSKRVTFVPLKYGLTKVQIQEVSALHVPGVAVNIEQKLAYANPEEVHQSRLVSIARELSPLLDIDADVLKENLRSRPLRYVPVMRRLPPHLSLALKEKKLLSIKETEQRRRNAATREEAEKIHDPLRSIALIPEHWRFYPDDTIASQVVGFLNTRQEAQYGIERTFDPQLRGQEGLINAVSDPQGGQIVTGEQTVIDPKDGDTVILTIDPFIQKEVETILQRAMEQYQADSGQAIVMDPFTGRIVALANTPLFERNQYGAVFSKEPIVIPPGKRREIVAEVYHPETNARIVKAYLEDIFTPEKRALLPEKVRAALDEVERLYDLHDLVRTYLYLGENTRMEIFPTNIPHVWLKYRNIIGVGAYLNRAIQEIYEPGSVLKPVTMAIAIDQGEVTPDDVYDDTGPVQVDEYTIKNALLTYYGKVTMTNCLELSINTCMTSVSAKLGKKLFHRMFERFGFGRITGIELEDELPGEVKSWRNWSDALLATSAFGQGLTVTPLQMITAWTPLANGGKLMRPTIVDSIIHHDGTTETIEPRIVDQVITPQSSETITAMLVSAAERGFAKSGKVPGYRIAGKTGTSQIAGPGGRYEAGTGSTVASFMGFAPVDHPRFLVLVKFDRPKNRLVVHGAATAGPTFKDIAAFLFKYYGIPPDEK